MQWRINQIPHIHRHMTYSVLVGRILFTWNRKKQINSVTSNANFYTRYRIVEGFDDIYSKENSFKLIQTPLLLLFYITQLALAWRKVELEQKLHNIQQVKKYQYLKRSKTFTLCFLFTSSLQSAANLPSMCLIHLQLCSAVFSQDCAQVPSGNLLARPI